MVTDGICNAIRSERPENVQNSTFHEEFLLSSENFLSATDCATECLMSMMGSVFAYLFCYLNCIRIKDRISMDSSRLLWISQYWHKCPDVFKVGNFIK